jgi:mRNA interferase MazF
MNDIVKIFVKWTKIKIRTHLESRKVYPKTKEVWWINIGQNIGSEINGKNDNFERPAVVIKKFNKLCILVAPISSKVKEGKYLIKFTNSSGGDNVVNMSQIRSISDKRFIRKIGVIDSNVFNEIRDNLIKFI